MGARLITGTGLMALNGQLTGNGPQDRQMRKVWQETANWERNTIEIGGKRISLDLMEPWGLLFTAIADVGDNMKLMGTEWATDRFQSIALAVASAPLSATYLKGVGDLFDFFSGEPGAQGRIIGNIMNAQVPLSGLRNDIGKILNPGLREINNSNIDRLVSIGFINE